MSVPKCLYGVVNAEENIKASRAQFGHKIGDVKYPPKFK